MGVLVVEIADAGEEAAGLGGEAPWKGGGLDKRFLDLDLAVACQRDSQLAVEHVVDAGREVHLGFAEREAAVPDAGLLA